MDLHHHFTVPASIEQTWQAFNDLSRIGSCLPGATIDSVDGDDFTGSVKIKLGPISLQYNGTGHYAERESAARRVVIVAKGKDKRGNGTASATITAELAAGPAANGSDTAGTSVDVTTDLTITGKPAQFGRGVIQDVSDKLLGQFVECIQGRLGGGAQAEILPPSGSATPTAQQSTTPPAGPIPPAGPNPTAAPTPPAGPNPTAEPSAPASSALSALVPEPSVRALRPSAPAPVAGPVAAEIDLFSTVGPVLLKRYAKPALAAVGAIGLIALLRKLFASKHS